jgi:hypothetical protein
MFDSIKNAAREIFTREFGRLVPNPDFVVSASGQAGRMTPGCRMVSLRTSRDWVRPFLPRSMAGPVMSDFERMIDRSSRGLARSQRQLDKSVRLMAKTDAFLRKCDADLVKLQQKLNRPRRAPRARYPKGGYAYT